MGPRSTSSTVQSCLGFLEETACLWTLCLGNKESTKGEPVSTELNLAYQQSLKQRGSEGGKGGRKEGRKEGHWELASWQWAHWIPLCVLFSHDSPMGFLSPPTLKGTLNTPPNRQRAKIGLQIYSHNLSVWHSIIKTKIKTTKALFLYSKNYVLMATLVAIKT